ncbi:MAG: hypothetical protein QXJ20_02900 [Candidatus Aenigmatarchaeota archaeon]
MGAVFEPAAILAGRAISPVARPVIKRTKEALISKIPEPTLRKLVDSYHRFYISAANRFLADWAKYGTPKFTKDAIINVNTGLARFYTNLLARTERDFAEKYIPEISALYETYAKPKIAENIGKAYVELEPSITDLGKYFGVKTEGILARIPEEELEAFLNERGLRGTEFLRDLRDLKSLHQDFDRVYERVTKRLTPEVSTEIKIINATERAIERFNQNIVNFKNNFKKYYAEKIAKILPPEYKERVDAIFEHLLEGRFIQFDAESKALIKELRTDLRRIRDPEKRALLKELNNLRNFVLRMPWVRRFIKQKIKSFRAAREKLASRLDEMIERLNKKLENTVSSAFERISIAKSPVGALGHRSLLSYYSNILTVDPERFHYILSKTYIQPYLLETYMNTMEHFSKAIVEKPYVEAYARDFFERLADETALERIVSEIEKIDFPKAIKAKFELKEIPDDVKKRIIEIEEELKRLEAEKTSLLEREATAVGKEKEAIRDLLDSIVKRKESLLAEKGELLLPYTKEGKFLFQKIRFILEKEKIPNSEILARTFLRSFYGFKKAETWLWGKRALITPFTDYYVAFPFKDVIDYLLLEKSVLTYPKGPAGSFLFGFVTFPKVLMLSLSPFHALSLLKSYAYSTRDVIKAIEEGYRFIRQGVLPKIPGIKALLKEPPKDYVETMLDEAGKNIREVMRILRDQGIELTEVPTTLMHQFELSRIFGEARSIRKDIGGLIDSIRKGKRELLATELEKRLSLTQEIFWGLYPYLKTKDLLEVAKLLEKGQITKEEFFKLADVINAYYGGMRELLKLDPAVRWTLRTIILAPDWQLSLLKQWGYALTYPQEKTISYLVSMLCYSYMMYHTIAKTAEPDKDAREIMKDFIDRGLHFKNPYEVLTWYKNRMLRFDPLGYEKEAPELVMNIFRLLYNPEEASRELVRIFFNRGAFVPNFLANLWEYRKGESPFFYSVPFWYTLLPFPFLIDSLITSHLEYNIPLTDATLGALLQSLSYRVFVVPKSKILAESILNRQHFEGLPTFLLKEKMTEQYYNWLTSLSMGIFKKKPPKPSLKKVLRAVRDSVIITIAYRKFPSELADLKETVSADEAAKKIRELAEKIDAVFSDYIENVVSDKDKTQMRYILGTKFDIEMNLARIWKQANSKRQGRAYRSLAPEELAADYVPEGDFWEVPDQSILKEMQQWQE